jgi:anaerobic selenocysteine-containing dehydrogenase
VAGSPERLTTRSARGELWRKVSWDEALASPRAGSRGARRSGPGALGLMTSSRSTNEAAYLLQKLFRVRFGTNHVDCCARVCHSSTALALPSHRHGRSERSSTTRARKLVFAGSSPPGPLIAGGRRRQAAPACPVVIDPRRVELADFAAVHLQLRPGTNVPLFHGLAKVLVEERLFDAEYVRERCEGLGELAKFLAAQSLDEIARITGVAAEAIVATARRLGAAGPALFVNGLGLSELTQGVASVRACSAAC